MRPANLFLRSLLAVACLGGTPGQAAEWFVSPSGNDANAGTRDNPFATISRAQREARTRAGKEPVNVVLRGGTYYLEETFALTVDDSGADGAPVVYAAAPGEEVGISGGLKLNLQWRPHKDGILRAQTPPDLAIDQLFIDGQRQHMARYPNFDADVRPYNGFAADAFSKERAARWANPAGGFIHAMHRAHWGGYHYRITGKNERGEVVYEGGWQNNRQMGMHPQHRFVENIFEELDAPGEWFHDANNSTLYYYPAQGVDLETATVEVARLRHLVEFNGTAGKPVRFVSLRGLIFRHAARTFMETKEPLLRSDWTIYRGGAIFFNGAEDCEVADCEFDQVGGNGVFVNNYNRRVSIRGCYLHDTGASAVAFVGEPKAVRNPLFEYRQRQDYAAIDKTPGPQTDNYPADCAVEDCLIVKAGVVEKQATGVQVSMSRGIAIRHCSIYDMSRAGINISEGTWGGHLIEFCDVFDTVKETGDHGSFNSWGRDRFWGLKNAPPEELPQLARLDAITPTVIRNSRWRCDHGWDVDLDDGSSNYEIYNNLFLRGGLKLREGFHRRVWNNIAINNTLHPHVWYDNSMDVVTNNVWMGAYRPAGGMPKGKWGVLIDRNWFTAEADRVKFAAHGCDANSIVGDPMFVDPATGDFRLKDSSPALKLGFKNFPMDRFGVQKPALKQIARAPELPEVGVPESRSPATVAPQLEMAHYWQGAGIKELAGEEYSAFGVSKDSGGVFLVGVPPGSAAARDGFRPNDLLQSLNGRGIKNIRELFQRINEAAGQPLAVGLVRGQQPQTVRVTAYDYFETENSTAEEGFKVVTLSSPAPTAAIQRIATRPGTHNESPAALHDGKLAANYGPVFGNGTVGGMYKVDLGQAQRISRISTWSHNQNNNRGAQHFVLLGSAAAGDPGWDVNDREKFFPIAEVDTTENPVQKYQGTRIRPSTDKVLAQSRWLLWVVYPVTAINENTAYQEFQVLILP